MPLSGLDERLLPALARLGPRGIGRLAPFRLLREVPQLGLVLIVAVVAGDLALVGQRYDGGRGNAGEQPAIQVDPTAGASAGADDTVGAAPLPGTQIDDYVSQRSDALTAAAAATPTRTSVAVVSFTSYLTPAEYAQRLPAGIDSAGVFVHLPVKRGSMTEMTPGVLLRPTTAKPLAAQLKALAAEFTKEAGENQHQGDTVTIFNSGNVAEKQGFYDTAADERLEATTLTKGGPFIYAGLVTGTDAALAAFAPMTRLVDLAPQGSQVGTLVAHGLLPEDDQQVSTLQPVDGFGAP